MFCASTLALASNSRLMTVVFPARTAQCRAVFLWYLSPRFTDTLNVSNSRVGSTLQKSQIISFTSHSDKRIHFLTQYTHTYASDKPPTSKGSCHSDPSYPHPGKIQHRADLKVRSDWDQTQQRSNYSGWKCHKRPLQAENGQSMAKSMIIWLFNKVFESFSWVAPPTV